MKEMIHFYSVGDPFGEFSNFFPARITLKKKSWPTTEHYFQAQKFPKKSDQDAVRKASSPALAARLGRNRRIKIRGDWEAIKINVMREALKAKFTQHPDLADLLLSTSDARLVEHTSNDSFWGDGGDGTGKNMLGRLLMELRVELQNSA